MDDNKLKHLEMLVNEAKENGLKFYGKKNKAAGTRLRGKLQEIVVLCKELRKEVSEVKGTF